MINSLIKKEEFRWSFRKKGTQVLNICTRLLLLYGFAAALMTGAPEAALANPAGGTVVGGAATITNTGTTETINQTTQNAEIKWSGGFNIAKGETTQINQPNANSSEIEEIFTTGQLTAINGSLSSNGRVIVINPNGVIIGNGGNVDTAGFIATSAGLADGSFNANTTLGALNFNKAGKANAKVVNKGAITVADEGLVALVAPTVRNDGLITGKLAKIQLGAADTFGVDFYGDGLINLAVGQSANKRTLKTENKGSIVTPGGQVLMTAAAASNVVDSVINNTGVIQATSIANHNGEIVLTGEGANVKVAGTLDVSGTNGGGSINVGGGAQGKGPLAHAATVKIAPTAVLNASAIVKGNGGNIVVWSDNATSFQGTALAEGGANGGNGGNVETSSAGALNIDGGTVNTLAANGATGDWLLDPTNVVIDGGTGVGSGGASTAYNTNPNAFTIYASQIEGTNSNITIQATHSITTVGDGNVADDTITLQANRSLTIETQNNTGSGSSSGAGIDISNLAFVTSGTGAITVQARTGTGSGNVIVGTLTSGSGDISIGTGNGTVTLDDAVTSASGDISVYTNGAITALGAIATSGAGASVALTSTGNSVTTQAITAAGGDIGINAAKSATLNGAITDSHSGSITINASTAGAVGNVSAAVLTTDDGSINVSAKHGTVKLNNAVTSNSGTIIVSASDALTALGNIGTGSADIVSLTSTGSSVNAQAVSSVGGDISVNAATSVTLNGAVGNAGAGAITITGSTGNVSVAALTSEDGNVTVSANNGSVTTGDVATADGGISLTSGHSGSITAGNLVITSTDGNVSPITVDASGALTVGDVSILNSGTTADVNDTIALSSGHGDSIVTGNLSISSTSGDVSALTVKSAGALTVNGAVSVANSDGGDPAWHSASTAVLSAKNDVNITGAGGVSVRSEDVDAPYVGSTATLTIKSKDGGVDIAGPISVSSTENQTASGGDDQKATSSVKIKAENDIVIGNAVTAGSTSSVTNDPGVQEQSSSLVSIISKKGDLWLSGAGPEAVAQTAVQAAVYTGAYYNETTKTPGNKAQVILSGTNKFYTLTYNADAATTTYGTAASVLTGTVTGFVQPGQNVSNDTTGALTFITPATVLSNVGSYAIDGSGLTAVNYTFAQAAGNATALIINPATLYVTPNAVSTTYDGIALNNAAYSDNTADYSITGYKNGQNAASAGVTLTGSLAFNGSTGTTVLNAGTYTQGTGTLALGSSNNNYVMSFANLAPNNYVIGQANLTITAKNDSETYNGLAYSGDSKGVTYSGFVNGQNASVLGGTLGYTGTSQGAVNAGSYTITPDGLTSGNYKIAFDNGTLAINPASLTIFATPDARTYNGTTASSATAIETGLVTADKGNLTIGSEQYSSANAGLQTLSITGYTLTDPANYTVKVYSSLGLISPEIITVSTSNVTKTYDGTTSVAGATTGPAPVVTSGKLYVNQSNGDTQDTLSGGNYAFTNANAGVGDKTVTVSHVTVNDGNSGHNYFVIYSNNTTSTINPAALTVTIINDPTKTYDGTTTATLNSGNYHLSGFIGSQGATVTQAVGSYNSPNVNGATTVTANLTGDIVANGGTLLSNYTLPTSATGAGAISPATLTYNATSASATYGTTASGLTGGVTGFVTGENQGNATTGTLAFTTSATSASPVGQYAINGSGLTADNGNYVFAQAAGNATALTINTASLIITASDGSKTFGNTYVFGAPGYTETGLVNSDSISGVTFSSLGAPALAPVGHYAIVASNAVGAGLSNYSIQYVPGDLNVKPNITFGPDTVFDELGRPIISVADKVINFYSPFEPIQTLTLNVNISLKGGNPFANIEPAAGGDDDNGHKKHHKVIGNNASDLSNIEPAAGGNGKNGPTKGNFACADDFLDGKSCAAQ